MDWTRLRQIYGGAFFQDDWKVSRRLTINAGMRYDLFTAPVDARDRGSLFDSRTGLFALPGQDGYTRSVLNGDHNNFGPRFGMAYQLRPKLVVRTGYGIFFGDSDRNSSSHMHGSQIPNVPIITAPVVDAQRTVTPPYTLSTPIKIEPYQPDLKAFSARIRSSAPSSRLICRTPFRRICSSTASACSTRPPELAARSLL